MRKTIIGIVVGGTIVMGGNTAYNWWSDLEVAKRTAELQSANPADWIDMQRFVVDGVPPGEVPMAHITFQILKPVAVRTTISPRNLETGESVCEGRVSALYDEPRPARSFSVPVSSLAGLQSCDFPPGEYTVSVTITPTDLATNVQLKPIIFEHHFSVALPPM
jgi:hypothetical protein